MMCKCGRHKVAEIDPLYPTHFRRCPVCFQGRREHCPACESPLAYTATMNICPVCHFSWDYPGELPDQSWREDLPYAGIYAIFHDPLDALRQLCSVIVEAEDELAGDGLMGASLACRIRALKEQAPEPEDTVETRVTGCARCGVDHPEVAWRRFARPVADDDGDWTHWAHCPTNGQPILMRFQGGE